MNRCLGEPKNKVLALSNDSGFNLKYFSKQVDQGVSLLHSFFN